MDAGRLAQLVNAPVHATCGRTGEGVDAALADAVRLATSGAPSRPASGRRAPRSARPVYPYTVRGRSWPAAAGSLTVEPRSSAPPPCSSRSRRASSAG